MSKSEEEQARKERVATVLKVAEEMDKANILGPLAFKEGDHSPEELESMRDYGRKIYDAHTNG